MVSYNNVFSGFAVRDLDAAREFYRNVVGIPTDDGEMGMLNLQLPKGGVVIVYPKPDHEPANYTILNIEVADIDAAVDDLVGGGVEILRYEGFQQDAKGIARGIAAQMGPDIAWFTDPSGNILSVLQSPSSP